MRYCDKNYKKYTQKDLIIQIIVLRPKIKGLLDGTRWTRWYKYNLILTIYTFTNDPLKIFYNLEDEQHFK